MTYSFIQRSGSDFTDAAIKKMTLDPLVIDGSLFRYDFINAYSNPNPDGAIANGAVFKNLVQGAADATYTSGSAGFIVAAGKKGLVCPGTNTSTSSFIALPSGEFDMHTEGGDHNFIEHLWFKEITGYNVVGGMIMGDRAAETSAYWGASPSQAAMYSGAGNGAAPYVLIRANGVAYAPPGVVNDSLLNAAHLLSMAYVAGTFYYYVDGALFGSVTYPSAVTLGLPTRRSHGTLVFGGLPLALETVTINGNVITFVASGAAGAQVNIGADATATAQALKTYINANKVALGVTAEGATTTIVVINRALATLLTLTETCTNVTLGAVVASKGFILTNYMKGDTYLLAGEDLTLSGRTALASAQAEFAGYRPKLVAAGLAS